MEQVEMQHEASVRKLEARIRKCFNRGCTRYGLLEDDDRILVALSGGKDSLMLLRLMAERARIYKPRIEVRAVHVVMDNIPYETDRSYLHQYCDELGVGLEILHRRFEESTDPRKTRCFLCSWYRRKAIFEYAADNGFNKVALGHHMDDILVTLLMNMTFEGSRSTMMPVTVMEHYPVTIIRPLCMVHEDDVMRMAALAGFQKQKVPCPYEQTTRRASVQGIFKQLEEMNPEARYSLWRAGVEINY